jgi:hypothetical protein
LIEDMPTVTYADRIRAVLGRAYEPLTKDAIIQALSGDESGKSVTRASVTRVLNQLVKDSSIQTMPGGTYAMATESSSDNDNASSSSTTKTKKQKDPAPVEAPTDAKAKGSDAPSSPSSLLSMFQDALTFRPKAAKEEEEVDPSTLAVFQPYHPELLDGCQPYNTRTRTFVPESTEGGGDIVCRRIEAPYKEAMMQAQREYVLHTEQLTFFVTQAEEYFVKCREYAERHIETLQGYVERNPSTENALEDYAKEINSMLELFHRDVDACNSLQPTAMGRRPDDIFLKAGNLDRLAFRGCANIPVLVDNAQRDILPLLLEYKHLLENMVADKDLKTTRVQITAYKRGWYNPVKWTSAVWGVFKVVGRTLQRLWQLATLRRVATVVIGAGVVYMSANALGLGAIGLAKAGCLAAITGLFRGLCPILRTPATGLLFSILLRKVLRSVWVDNVANPNKHQWLRKLAKWGLGLGTAGASELYAGAAARLFENAPNKQDMSKYIDDNAIEAGNSAAFMVLDTMLILSVTAFTTLFAGVLCPMINATDDAVQVASGVASTVEASVQATGKVMTASTGVTVSWMGKVSSWIASTGGAWASSIQMYDNAISATAGEAVQKETQQALQGAAATDPNVVTNAIAGATATTVMVANDVLASAFPLEAWKEQLAPIFLNKESNEQYQRLVTVLRYLLFAGVSAYALARWGGTEQLEFASSIPDTYRKLPAAAADASRAATFGTYRPGVRTELLEKREYFLRRSGASNGAVANYFDMTKASGARVARSGSPIAAATAAAPSLPASAQAGNSKKKKKKKQPKASSSKKK